MRIGFYAPLKATDHPVPSGDRTMARALIKALAQAGHMVEPTSRLRSFIASPDFARQRMIAADAQRESARLAQAWQAGGAPDLWFTYHNHYKAPDLLGPVLTDRFGLPYVIAEASHAPKRADAWGSWHGAAEAASRAATLHVCFTRRDREGLRPLLGPETSLLDLPPFIDLARFEAAPVRPAGGRLRMIVVAMMRPGDKLASYMLLAEALGRLTDLDWHLDIVGGGPSEGAVRELFANLERDRVTWHGVQDQRATWTLFQNAHLFVWPGFGEAFGMAYLEAQAAGLPVLALNTAGVPSVVQSGLTGLLVENASSSAFADALRRLMLDRTTLERMGKAAQRFVRHERTLERAAASLDGALRHCLEWKAGGHGRHLEAP